RDVGEPGLAGWTIYIDSNTNGLFDSGELSTVTDGANGAYMFNNLPSGIYVVREVLQQGWIQSYPNSGQHSVTLTSGTSYLSANFANYQYAEIRGLVFHDLDADGNQRPEEPGLGGWTVSAFRDDNLNGLRDDPNEVLIQVLTEYDIPATTGVNEAGRYTFTQLEPGTYVVSLVPSAGWIQSVPDPNRNGSYSFSIFAGGVSTNKIFGAYKPVEVSGYVFADPDGDGQTSPLEANDPLPGWFVYLDQDGDGQMDPGETRAETNNQGNYIFTGLKPSPYTVALAIPAGWVQTAPDSATYQLVLKSNDPPVVQRNFLAFKLGKINGYVWEDADGDRLWDPGEPALADWTVEAFEDLNGNGKFDPATETQLTAVTDAKGAYAFTGLLHGTYVVSEVLKDGWVSSPPIGVTYTVVIFSGYDVTARNFGNFRPGEITGIKWLDENADALLDEAEVGLAGWTITATNTATGGVISAVTWEDDPDTVDVDETGWYALTGLVPGEYVVAETAQAGWVQTVPAETIYMVVIVSGQVATGYDFGNIGTGTVSGALWNDVADLGLWDADELPMAGRTVKIFKDYNADGILSGVEEMASLRQTVTDENGRYEFADLAFGDYAIFQDIPAGYVQTYPTDTPNYAIQIGHATVLEDLDFGSAQGGVIEGNKWEDLNADGIWDQAEPPLQGWAITAFRDLDEDGLFDQDIETLLETVTIENGSYQFSALLPGSYVVAEIMPAVGNWQYSSPPDGKQTVAVEIAQTVQADFGNYRLGAISGQVWNDGDFDGQVGQSEEGLEGWTVTAQKVGDESNEVTSSSTDVPIEIPDEDFVESTLTVTGLSGLITDVNVTLDITHTEVSDLSIWLVSPSGTEVWLVNELPNAGENFTGTTFDDQADMWIGDGVAPYTGAYRPYDALASFDLEDPNGLWTLVIEDYYGGGVGTLNSWSISFTTGELYEIISPSTDVPVGIPDEDFVESTLTVTGLSGHIIDANVTLDVTHTEVSDLSIWLVSPSGTEVRLVDGVPNGGENFTGTTFDDEADMWIDDGVAPYTGAYMPYADELALFDGEDPNGLWTLVIVDWYGGDVGTLNSWSISFTIIAEDGGVPTTWTTVTDENGQYGFADLQPGEYVITVESRDGWRHTQPDDATQDVTIISGYEPNDVNFGITTGAMVQGTVWYDANRDGVKDVDEEFLPDQTAYIDLNGDGLLDGNEPSGVSDVDGLYAIVALPPGTYTVRLAPADGWSQTFPADNGGYAIDLGIAQLEPNLDFGAQALPVPDEASFEINEDQTLNGELTASDPEDNELTFTVEQTPANGELLLESGGAFTYTPNENFNGTDTFTYAVSDGSGKTVATATITVNPVNDLPVIVLPEEPVAVNEDEQAIIPVVVSDVETQAENLIYTITFGPLHGTLTVGEDNALTYQPDADFSGEDSFAFTVTDTGDPAGDKAVSPPLTTDEKVVRIDVNPINDRPVAYGQDLEIFYEGVPYEIQLEEGTDVETPAGQLIYQLVPGSGPAHGVVVIDPATGVATYTAHPNYRGGDTDSFSFVVLDTGQPVGVDVQTSQPVKVNIYIPSFTYFDAKRPALREMFPGSKLILKVSMSGPGTAMAFFDDVDHKNISRIVMRGTTNKTRLTISGARNFYSTVEDIFVHGSLKSIKATKTDLTGDISVDGWVGSIAFDDVEGDNQHTLSIGGAGKPVSITFDDVKELGITAPVTAIKKLTVTQWQDDNGVIDTIQALSIRSLKAKKAKKPDAGDFAANLKLTDASQKLT
ncbi:MAG: tandem-95 repeat protein, partial [Planctomycetes bacterium]|nr:tandem-95 repeat protein [Planctomycetota bacterium]